MSEQPTAPPPPAGRPAAVRHRWLIVIGGALAVIALDQLTKWWAVQNLAPPPTGEGRIVDVVWKLKFVYAENSGMAFSRGAGAGRWIGLVAIGITVAMVVIAAKATSRAQVVLIGVVIGGALGNVVDRLFRAESGFMSGRVVDFIYTDFWPTFNVADTAIVVGGILLVIFSAREPRPAEDEPDPEAVARPEPDVGNGSDVGPGPRPAGAEDE
jgi:signal peptidase II